MLNGVRKAPESIPNSVSEEADRREQLAPPADSAAEKPGELVRQMLVWLHRFDTDSLTTETPQGSYIRPVDSRKANQGALLDDFLAMPFHTMTRLSKALDQLECPKPVKVVLLATFGTPASLASILLGLIKDVGDIGLWALLGAATGYEDTWIEAPKPAAPSREAQEPSDPAKASSAADSG